MAAPVMGRAHGRRMPDFTRVPTVVEDGIGRRESTISVNGGPKVPMSVARAALDVIKRRKATVPAEQTDLEDDALGGRDPDNEAKVAGIAADRLSSLIERIERLEEEKKELASDIKDIFAEAKSAGFDVPVMRKLIAIRKKEPADVEEAETLLDIYRRALGM